MSPRCGRSSFVSLPGDKGSGWSVELPSGILAGRFQLPSSQRIIPSEAKTILSYFIVIFTVWEPQRTQLRNEDEVRERRPE